MSSLFLEECEAMMESIKNLELQLQRLYNVYQGHVNYLESKLPSQEIPEFFRQEETDVKPS